MESCIASKTREMPAVIWVYLCLISVDLPCIVRNIEGWIDVFSLSSSQVKTRRLLMKNLLRPKQQLKMKSAKQLQKREPSRRSELTYLPIGFILTLFSIVLPQCYEFRDWSNRRSTVIILYEWNKPWPLDRSRLLSFWVRSAVFSFNKFSLHSNWRQNCVEYGKALVVEKEGHLIVMYTKLSIWLWMQFSAS